jgi:serine/threonine protein kinase
VSNSEEVVFDEELAGRLPSLLAQLYADTLYAKSALERHQSAFYLWEATVKLMGGAAVVTWAARGEPNEKIAESLKTLARPALGHWWGYCRTLLPRLAESDPGFAAQREIVLGRSRDDLPRLAGLDALLREAAGQAAGSRALVNLQALFDRIVSYRNREIGHGAAGRRPREFYDRMGHALLAGGTELLRTLDPLAGRMLVYVDEIRKADDGGWAAACLELRGEWPRRIAPMRSDATATTTTLHPHRLFLRLPGAEPTEWTSFYPLALFNADSNDLLLLNGRPKDRETEYLSYRYATHEQHPDAPCVQELLTRLLGMDVSPVQVQEWAEDVPRDEAAKTPDVASTGRSIGDFELLTQLGKGAMGVVYRARQAILGREVALKCQLRVGDARTDQRFQREIRALGRVNHPNLVRVFASGNDGDQWFYAMELVEGATLAMFSSQLETRLQDPSKVTPLSWRETLSIACDQTRKEEQPLSPGPDATVVIEEEAEAPITVEVVDRDYISQVVDLIRQSAEAAHALHKAGVVHRDIKPGNVMVSADGRQAYLMDLGLAHVVEEGKGNLTRTRQFIGSLPYASPEQVAATSSVDHRSDIYSLGATLWELLTLRHLFDATDETPPPEIMRRIQFDPPVSPRLVNRRVSPDLEAVILRCLEKNPARRYATACDLADDLARAQRSEPTVARHNRLRMAWGRFVRKTATVRRATPYLLTTLLLLSWLVYFSAQHVSQDARNSQVDRGTDEPPGVAVQRGKESKPAEVDIHRSADRQRRAQQGSEEGKRPEVAKTLRDALKNLAQHVLDVVIKDQKQHAIAVGDFSAPSGLAAYGGSEISETIKSLLEELQPGLVQKRAALSLRGRYDKMPDPRDPSRILIKVTAEITNDTGDRIDGGFAELRDINLIAELLGMRVSVRVLPPALRDALKGLAHEVIDVVVRVQKQDAIAVGAFIAPTSLAANGGLEISETLESLLNELRPGLVQKNAALSLRGSVEKVADPRNPDLIMIQVAVEIVDGVGEPVTKKSVEIRDTRLIAGLLGAAVTLPPAQPSTPLRGVEYVNVAALPAQTCVLLSCSPGEFAFESRSLGTGHGAFFFHVIKGLEGAAKDQNGAITWDSLATYVRSEVPRTIQQLFGKEGGEQNPNEIANVHGQPLVLSSTSSPGAAPGNKRRLAFLVGVVHYNHPDLKDVDFTEKDIIELADVLKSRGFEVVTLATALSKETSASVPTAQNIRTRFAQLLDERRLTKDDAILFAFCGHGFEPVGSDDPYLCPQDAIPTVVNSRPTRPETLISLSEILNKLRQTGIGHKLLLIDACRNDPSLR